MKYFSVTYEVGNGIFSGNIITSNCGREDQEAVRETAERHAARHGYKVAFVSEISESQVMERVAKGMPMSMIDDEAEQAHDPSIAFESEITRFHELLQEAGEIESRMAEINLELAGIEKILQRAGINPLEVDL